MQPAPPPMAGPVRWARPAVYAASIAIGALAYAASRPLPGSLATIRFEEWLGFAGFAYVYLAVLVSPLYAVFPQLPGKPLANRARRAIGISAFCFAAAHAYIAFFGLLHGFAGIPFFDATYRADLALSLVALAILFLLAATSFDVMVRAMGSWWKRLHRFVYLAGVLIIAHVFFVGADYAQPESLVSEFTLLAAFALLVLEALRFDLRVAIPKRGAEPRFSGIGILAVLAVALLYVFVSAHGLSFSAHGGHAQ